MCLSNKTWHQVSLSHNHEYQTEIRHLPPYSAWKVG